MPHGEIWQVFQVVRTFSTTTFTLTMAQPSIIPRPTVYWSHEKPRTLLVQTMPLTPRSAQRQIVGTMLVNCRSQPLRDGSKQDLLRSSKPMEFSPRLRAMWISAMAPFSVAKHGSTPPGKTLPLEHRKLPPLIMLKLLAPLSPSAR